MECDFCGREIEDREIYYHCEQDSECQATDWNELIEADVCFECFNKAFKSAIEERKRNVDTKLAEDFNERD